MNAAGESLSLQERFAPKGICFGCGPANAQGLRIRSFVRGEEVVADWAPSPQYQAFPGMLNGGIIGALLDCHSNWAATWHLMQKHGWDKPAGTVTADYRVEFLAPTPAQAPVHLRARVVDSGKRSATVEAELSSGSVITAKCRGTFVAVQEGHPAYHRWE
jgi:acyl-coenzyme A thioesterase PaaI-like protein